MLTIRFLEWFGRLPIVGFGRDGGGFEFGRGLGGFVKNQQTIELGLMYTWAVLAIAGGLAMLGIGITGGAVSGRTGYSIALDLGFFLPMYSVCGLLLHYTRYISLHLVERQARLRAQRRADSFSADDAARYEPHGVFGWWVTSHDGDFVFQGVVALVGVIIKVAAGP